MAHMPIKSYGAHFAARSVARNYLYRPPYSPEVFETLSGLLPAMPCRVLDAGCGPGKLSLGLLDHAGAIDAVDPSGEMLELARSLPRGRDPKITWMEAKIEDARLSPPYGLIVAGASFHWMDRERTLDLFANVLAPDGVFALLDGDGPVDAPWRDTEREIFSDFIVRLQGERPDFAASDVARLERGFLDHPRFVPAGRKITAPFAVRQTIEDYLACQHSRATWAPEFMGEEMAAEFDGRLAELLGRHARDGVLAYSVRTRMEWGKPLPRQGESAA